MPLNETFIRQLNFDESIQTYTDRDTILYALGVGLGTDPNDPRQLRYLNERGLMAMPSLANVLAHPGAWMTHPQTGITVSQMVHGQQHLEIHHPLPAQGTVVARTRIDDVVDKGREKGAIVHTSRTIRDQATGMDLVTIRHALFCRADGGFNASAGNKAPEPTVAPLEGLPDLVCDLPTLPQQALLYRLSGDRHPLHIDPGYARRAGFARPILHGLCTFGVATHALLRSLLDYDSSRLTGIGMRFRSPVFPGETIRTEIWRSSAESVRFRCLVADRNQTVIDLGTAELRQAPVQ